MAAYDNCRIYELSEQLYVSRATIHKDLLALSNDMNIYDITLHRKNNNGISIEGKEKNIRNFLLDLMLKDNGYQLFIELYRMSSIPGTALMSLPDWKRPMMRSMTLSPVSFVRTTHSSNR